MSGMKRLLASLILAERGATFLTSLQGSPVRFRKQASDGTAYWTPAS
mgnify:CR=1 FL=1